MAPKRREHQSSPQLGKVIRAFQIVGFLIRKIWLAEILYVRGFPSDFSLAWITILWTNPTDIMLTSKLLRP